MRVVVAHGAKLADADAWRALQLAGKVTAMTEADRTAVLQAIVRRELVVIDNDICEPVEVFADQERANRRAIQEHKRTGQTHVIVLNTEL